MTDLRVSIDLNKLMTYLLNVNHPRGASKARFFLRHGFHQSDPFRLADTLLRHALTNWPGRISSTAWGERHQIVAPMTCPDGTSRSLLSVWEIPHGESIAKFLTAYPS